MKFALFAGCKIPFFLPQYGLAGQAVLNALEVELVDMEFNCCGYPIRHRSFEAFVLSAARNRNGVDVPIYGLYESLFGCRSRL